MLKQNKDSDPFENLVPVPVGRSRGYKKKARDRKWDKQTLQAMVDCYDPADIAQWLAEFYVKRSDNYGATSKIRMNMRDLAVFYGRHAVDKLKGQSNETK